MESKSIEALLLAGIKWLQPSFYPTIKGIHPLCRPILTQQIIYNLKIKTPDFIINIE